MNEGHRQKKEVSRLDFQSFPFLAITDLNVRKAMTNTINNLKI